MRRGQGGERTRASKTGPGAPVSTKRPAARSGEQGAWGPAFCVLRVLTQGEECLGCAPSKCHQRGHPSGGVEGPAPASKSWPSGSFPHVLQGLLFCYSPSLSWFAPCLRSLVRNKGCVQQRVLGPGPSWLGPGPEGCQS